MKDAERPPDPRGLLTPDDLVQAFNHLRQQRARTGQVQVSIRDLAKKTGRAPSTLSEYFRGTRLPTVEVYQDLLLALGIKASEMHLWLEARNRIAELATQQPVRAPAPSQPEQLVDDAALVENDPPEDGPQSGLGIYAGHLIPIGGLPRALHLPLVGVLLFSSLMVGVLAPLVSTTVSLLIGGLVVVASAIALLVGVPSRTQITRLRDDRVRDGQDLIAMRAHLERLIVIALSSAHPILASEIAASLQRISEAGDWNAMSTLDGRPVIVPTGNLRRVIDEVQSERYGPRAWKAWLAYKLGLPLTLEASRNFAVTAMADRIARMTNAFERLRTKDAPHV